MENEILKEIRGLKAFQEKKFEEIDSNIQKLDAKIDKVHDELNAKIESLDVKIKNLDVKIKSLDVKIKNLDVKIDKVEKEIINEYKSFVNTVDKVNKKQIKAIGDKVNGNTNDLNKYKEKVKMGIQLFEKAVG